MSAVFSACHRYRYRLDRDVDMLSTRIIGFMLHNGSKAGVELNDPTSTRCIGFGRGFGARRIVMVNPWAGVATKPSALWAMDDPIGPDNDRYIASALAEIMASGGFLIVGWGVVSPPKQSRAAAQARLVAVQEMIRASGVDIRALGVNANGSPKHPLYVRADSPALPWPDPKKRSAA